MHDILAMSDHAHLRAQTEGMHDPHSVSGEPNSSRVCDHLSSLLQDDGLREIRSQNTRDVWKLAKYGRREGRAAVADLHELDVAPGPSRGQGLMAHRQQ